MNGFAKALLEIFEIAVIIGSLVIGYEAGTRHQQIGRFQPISQTMAVDTKTGQLCYTFDPLGNGSDKIPLCKNMK